MERLQAAQAPQHGNGHCCMLNNILVFVIKKNPFQLADDNYEDAYPSPPRNDIKEHQHLT